MIAEEDRARAEPGPDKKNAAAPSRIWLLSLLAFALTLLAGLTIIAANERSHVLELRAAASNAAAGAARTVQERLGRSLSATYAVAAVLTQGKGKIENFDELARHMLGVYGGISSLQLAKDGIVSQVVPLAGNEKAIGHNLLADTARNKEARLALETRQLTLAGPFELIQGGLAVVGRLPVFLDDHGVNLKFWGFATALIHIRDLLGSSRLADLRTQGYHYRLWRNHPDTGDHQIIAGSTDRPFEAPVDHRFDVPNGAWTLSLEPVAGWHSPNADLTFRVALATLIAFLVGFLTHTMLSQPLRLRREVAHRTQELAAANQRLNAEIDVRKEAEAALHLSRYSLEQAADALIWIAEDGRILDANRAAGTSFGYAREELLALTIAKLEPGYSDTVWQAHWSELRRKGTQTRETTFRTKDGRPLPVEIVANHVLFNDKEMNCAFVRDISERLKSELDLRIAAIAFDSQEGMVVTDAQNTILRVNRAFTEITGYLPEEAIGQTPAILKSGRQDPDFYRTMWQKLQDEKSWSGEIWNRRKNGDIYPEWLSITAVTDGTGKITNFVAAFSDTSGRVAAERQIRNLAFYDHLTKLANRRLLGDRLQVAMASGQRSNNHGALLFLDLDNFKTLNDTKGHEAGDNLLIEVARRLKSCVREVDTVARVGGDEFAIVLQDLGHNNRVAMQATQSIAGKVLTEVSRPYLLNDIEHHSTTSIGICLFQGQEHSIDELFKRADTAMYGAKNAGRNAIRFFDPAMQEALEARSNLEAKLRNALQEDEFLLNFQLQIDNTGQPIGAEVLLRWQQHDGLQISPEIFIPLAEDSGLIIPIGQWVLATACKALQSLQQNPQTQHLHLAVNVSPRQFRDAKFVDSLREILALSKIQPDKLKLELTERVVLDNVSQTVERMHEIRKLGIHFSMDDFGTGYSSLAYLQRLPLSQLKIDQSFVRDLNDDSNDAAIVRAIITLGTSLGLQVIAEGVETDAQRRFLDSHGCHAYQGYLFGRPLPLPDFIRLLHK